MRNTETGEFELVLGNRQLLSGFFVVVVLFGVFFTMGYIVGRNSAPSARAALGDAAAASTPAPAQSESRPEPISAAAPPPAESPAEGGAPAPQPKPEGSAQPLTQPAQDTAASKPADGGTAAAAGAAAIAEPQPGQRYLQVMAVKRPEAEVVQKTLKDRGFPALLGTGPNELVRVLVGPFEDQASLGRTKGELENAGFHPIVQKY